MQIEQGTAVGVLEPRHGSEQSAERRLVRIRQKGQEPRVIKDQLDLRRLVQHDPIGNIDVQCLIPAAV